MSYHHQLKTAQTNYALHYGDRNDPKNISRWNQNIISGTSIFVNPTQNTLFSFFPLHLTFKMPAFARSITPFFQTARSALRQGNAVSPLQHALRRQNGAAVINAARSYATAFERSKPHVNIGMHPFCVSMGVC